MRTIIHRMFRQLAAQVLSEGRNDPLGLLVPWRHPHLVEAQRAALLISRVRLVSALFAFLTPLWIFADVIFLPNDIWPQVGTGRLVATAAFIVLSILYQKSDRLLHAYIALALLFLVPTLFFAYTHFLFAMHPHPMEGSLSAGLVAGYSFLPFVIAAGFSVFPLTALEGLIFAIPVVVVQSVASQYGTPFLGADIHIGLLWLLALIVAIAVLSGMSQLHFLSEIIIKTSHDPLTDGFTRATGEELLDKYCALAARNGTSVTLIFFDLDHFKAINDQYGHEAGDSVLQNAGRKVLSVIRREDLFIRWGGEEFLVVMPRGPGDNPFGVISRIAERGLGLRPDGTPVTASMGVADLVTDRVRDLNALIRLADERMYRAKGAGRNRLCMHGTESEEFIDTFFKAA